MFDMRRAQRPGKAMTEDTNSQAGGPRLDGRVRPGSVALRPCPFCGGPAVIWGTGDTASVRCRECDAHVVRFVPHTLDGEIAAEAKAVAAWNKREPTAYAAAAVAALDDAQEELRRCQQDAIALQDENERLREALQAMEDCSHTMDIHCCARASQLAAAALRPNVRGNAQPR